MEEVFQDIKKIKLENKHHPVYFVHPHQNANWKKNKVFLEQIKSGSVASIGDLEQHYIDYQDVQIINLSTVLRRGDNECLTEFIPTVLPFIANLALRVEELFQEKEVIILQTEKREANHLTREQVASLLSNMFFLTLEKQLNHEGALPDTYDFKNWITTIIDKKRNVSNQQKLICLLHYFWRVYQELTKKESEFGKQIITYERLINENEDVFNSIVGNEQKMGEIIVDDNKGIESYEDYECVHVDFANKFLGGGVLRTGCVQEEIMLAVTPEALVGMLFSQRQKDKDALFITGAERFCEFKGYSDTFTFVGPHSHSHKLDTYNRKQTFTLAINAISFKQKPQEQYSIENIEREQLKSFIGFQGSPFSKESQTSPIISGNWGCGVFKGDPQLKLVIQWLSVSLLSRKLIYCTFKEKQLLGYKPVLEVLKNQSIKNVYKLIMDYSKIANTNKKTPLFDFILTKFKK